MTSGSAAARPATASSPVVTAVTAKPAYSSTSRASLRLRGLSSTSSTDSSVMTAPLRRSAAGRDLGQPVRRAS